jgi:hypothetical protein
LGSLAPTVSSSGQEVGQVHIVFDVELTSDHTIESEYLHGVL